MDGRYLPSYVQPVLSPPTSHTHTQQNLSTKVMQGILLTVEGLLGGDNRFDKKIEYATAFVTVRILYLELATQATKAIQSIHPCNLCGYGNKQN